MLLYSTDVSLLTEHGCNNYTVLSEADRAQGHIVINASNNRCDSNDLVPGWYRFQGATGDRMADKCVPAYHCGTRYPGWLSGTHPTVSEGGAGAHPTVAEGVVTHRVCYHWSNNCCIYHNNIRIKNCTAYFVYELSRLYFCYLRYCGNGGASKFRMFLTVSVGSQNIKFVTVSVTEQVIVWLNLLYYFKGNVIVENNGEGRGKVA